MLPTPTTTIASNASFSTGELASMVEGGLVTST
jgi:hypothetical protein